MSSTGEAPSLSVVVNNYNYARYLPEALDSAIAQMNSCDELIVVDDGSTDDSATILNRYDQQQNVKLITQKNQGQLHAVCNGIAAAQGDVLVLLDSDDCFIEGYLERLRALYTELPQVSYVFAAAQCVGDDKVALGNTNRTLKRNSFPGGEVGETKWAALLFQEYVGIPTSGNSLRRELANSISSLLTEAASDSNPMVLSPLLTKLFGVSATESSNPGYSADGVIVRCASILEARKYYDARPGFLYRIHGGNKYAGSTALGRRYLRYVRKQHFAALLKRTGYFIAPPSAVELQQEILQRSFGEVLLRRLLVRNYYCIEILKSRGSLGEKRRALAAAFGLGGAPS